MAIVYAVVAQQSLGELLVGSVFPGPAAVGHVRRLHHASAATSIRALGPALPLEERVSCREKLRLLRNTIAPILLIMLVLGVIFFGIATPVEAAGIGTFGALVRVRAAPAADLAGDPGGRPSPRSRRPRW